MKTKFGSVYLLATALMLGGCYTTTGTISKDPVSYFQISNVRPGLTAIVDENPPVTLEGKKGKALLSVSPGKHRIRVLQGSSAVVDRVVLVSDLQTLEIIVP